MPDSSSSLSVVIPTYNRATVLAKALEGYLSQSSEHLIGEVIVVDDGSTDDTEATVKEIARRSPFPVRHLRQQNQGPATARNLGIKVAQSPLILFTDSDIIPDRRLVEQHVHVHAQHPRPTSAVLGYVTWDPELNPTPFMRWYGERVIFGFGGLKDKYEVSFHFFYTCNVSVKTEFLRASGYFNEDFKTAAYEDTELGYRLSKAGLQLLYNPDAIGYHHQFFSFEDACRKKSSNRAAAELFFSKQAGQQVQAELTEKWLGSGRRFARRLAPTMATLASVAKPLIDSRIPLPHSIYRLLYWNAIRESFEQRVITNAIRGTQSQEHSIR